MIRIAFSSLCAKYIDDMLSTAQQNRDRAIEWDLNFIPPTLNGYRIDSIIKTIEEQKISIRYHLPYSFVEIAHPDEAFRDYSVHAIKEYLKFIHKLGGQYAIMHVGYVQESCLDHALRGVEKVASFAKKLKISICVENLIHGLSCTKLFWDKILEIDNVYLCLDIGHAEYLKRRNNNEILNVMSAFKSKIVHAHIYDYEDEHMNHIPFSPLTLENNIWIPILLNTPCRWYTMELDILHDQQNQSILLQEMVLNV